MSKLKKLIDLGETVETVWVKDSDVPFKLSSIVYYQQKYLKEILKAKDCETAKALAKAAVDKAKEIAEV